MKKLIVITLSISLFLTLGSMNLFSQQKKFFLGLQGGIFLPSSELIYGYQAISYDSGSPDGLIASGFGTGGDFNLSFQYVFSNLGIHFNGGARIMRRYINMALAPDGDEEEYDNTLNLFPVELGLVYHFLTENRSVVPYYSAGFCGYYGTMGMKHFVENGLTSTYSGSAFTMGLFHALGMYIAVYHDLLFNAEIKMNFASGTWELEDQAENADASIKYEKLNTGGTAFKMGLAFRF